jgi:hypothetical protein
MPEKRNYSFPITKVYRHSQKYNLHTIKSYLFLPVLCMSNSFVSSINPSYEPFRFPIFYSYIKQMIQFVSKKILYVNRKCSYTLFFFNINVFTSLQILQSVDSNDERTRFFLWCNVRGKKEETNNNNNMHPRLNTEKKNLYIHAAIILKDINKNEERHSSSVIFSHENLSN